MKSNGTILIVDDEPEICKALEVILSQQGYNLAFAPNCKICLSKARELSPDLILMDVMLPDASGFEACRSLRSDPLLSEVPIIIVTGLGDRDSRLRGLEAGADDFLTKPFEQAELLARVRTITRLSRYRKLESRINRLSAVYDISGALNSTIDLDALLEFIVQQTKELLDVEGISILFLDIQTDELYFPIVLMENEESEVRIKKIRFPANYGIAGWVIREGSPALVLDTGLDDRFYKGIDGISGFTTKSILCVPLKGKEGIFGAIEAINKKNGKFTEDDQVLLEVMAGNIAVSIEKANLHRDLERVEAILRHQSKSGNNIGKRYCFEDIIGNSVEIREVIRKAKKVAMTNATVLIYGETGTGKELMAQAIHQASPRTMRNFVPINCAAIPESLLESELFGHERGAFTSANTKRIGRFEEANGGTIFLDEVGDMPLSLQVKLLRVLEEGYVRPLGGSQNVFIDVRVIAATQKDLTQLIAEEKFRRDLYYRLKVVQLEMPSLCERHSDIPLLIEYFIRLYSEELWGKNGRIEKDALDILCQYDYPGNVRELKHIIESAMILSKDGAITADLLPKEISNSHFPDEKLDVLEEYMSVPENDEELKTAKVEAQRRIELMFLMRLLAATRGNVSEAASKAGMNRSWLSQMVSKHQLDLDQFRRNSN